jgi:nicotinate-nucleotide adenylyltransferase
MKRIALFGGVFDPPHMGHVACITSVLNSGLADEVWVVPVADDRMDKRSIAPASLRRRMIQAMLDEYFDACNEVRLEPIQLDGELPGCFTVDLLAELGRRHPEDKFLFIAGADNLGSIPSWKDGQKLFDRVNWVIFQRPGDTIPPGLPKNFNVLKGPSFPSFLISSTMTRDYVRAGKRLNGIVPKAVQDIIRANSLYTK